MPAIFSDFIRRVRCLVAQGLLACRVGGLRPFVNALVIVAMLGGEGGTRFPDFFEQFVGHGFDWVSVSGVQMIGTCRW